MSPLSSLQVWSVWLEWDLDRHSSTSPKVMHWVQGLAAAKKEYRLQNEDVSPLNEEEYDIASGIV